MESIIKNIKDGIYILLPYYENLPDLDLVLGKTPLPSLEYGTNYFLHISRVNDLNRMPTDMLKLFTHNIMLPENDLEKVYDILNIKSVKSYGRTIKADAIVADLSARNKLFKKEREGIKSNNYLTENNLYVSDYTMLTLDIFRPLFDIVSEKYCIVKLPTLFGRCVIDSMRIYCSIFKNVRLFKCVSDSWLKDSSIMVASDINKKNLDIFMLHIRSVTKSNIWKDSNSVQFSILKEPVDKEFINKFLEFSNKVYESLYYIHSLLYLSMTSDSKSIENEYQRRLAKALL
ncbi:small subunit of mRNA capping enzyme [Yokapox virus]|uniref:Small subunit of mRNA capping enzyme n=1 Tax=Yokapox virus TaxID=1076255 RepID=G3EIH7_9POXV|nr:small subunit of mRNA capping enzyme [Yokapox virus]AEN03688.1 small subunit of mRNA capping enzyme [Yokapox virus]